MTNTEHNMKHTHNICKTKVFHIISSLLLCFSYFCARDWPRAQDGGGPGPGTVPSPSQGGEVKVVET